MCSLFSVLTLFDLILENMSTNFVFLDMFDTCDVMYIWSISLLPPIVLDNLYLLKYEFNLPDVYEEMYVW